MNIKRLILFVAFFASISNAFCQPIDESESPVWESQCNLPTGKATLKFQSKSGDVTEDDMRVDLTIGENTINIPIESGWYHSQIQSVKSLCNKVSAFKVNDKKILFMYSIDNRPLWNQLSLVLFDSEFNKVIDTSNRIGEIKSVNNKGKEKMMTVKYINTDEIKIKLINGSKGLTDTSVDFSEGWMNVSIVNGKLKNKWANK